MSDNTPVTSKNITDKELALSEVTEFTYDMYLGGDGHFSMLDFINMAIDATKKAVRLGASEAEVKAAEALGKSRWYDEVKRRTGIVLSA